MRNEAGHRRCYLCDETKPATDEFFPRDKNRLLGIGYQCRPCAKIAKQNREKPRPQRWANMAPEKKAARYHIQKKHIAAGGWKHMRVGAYKYYDKKRGMECDLTGEWFAENIQGKPCIYCHRTNVRIGCDRIDNSIGHTMANVVPACRGCNVMRGNHFSHEEMMELAPHFRAIIQRRLQNASNPGDLCNRRPT